MNLRITALYRESDIAHDVSKPTSDRNMGGGVAIQRWYLSQAIPNIHITSNIEEAGDICLTEALWLGAAGDALKERIDAWCELKAFKILWNNDLMLARLPGALREQIIDGADVIATTSKYGRQLLGAFSDDVVLLRDPLDIDLFEPASKAREIYSNGQVCAQKNTQSIIDIFNNLPVSAALKKTYIGSTQVWGQSNAPLNELLLEASLKKACDSFENRLPYDRIPDRIAGMWGIVLNSRYDISSFAMMEAMLSGCWLFTGKHLLYDERPGKRFSTTAGAVKQIMNQLNETPPESGVINEEARQFIVERNSYDVFRSQFNNLIGAYTFGA